MRLPIVALLLAGTSAANAEVRVLCNPFVSPNPCYNLPRENIDPLLNAEVNRRQNEARRAATPLPAGQYCITQCSYDGRMCWTSCMPTWP